MTDFEKKFNRLHENVLDLNTQNAQLFERIAAVEGRFNRLLARLRIELTPRDELGNE